MIYAPAFDCRVIIEIMTIFLIVLSCLLWTAAFLALPKRVILGPALSYCAMLLMSFTKYSSGINIGTPLFPLTGSLLISWLLITVIVLFIIIMQDPAIRVQSRGVAYMETGGVAGMTVGIAFISILQSLTLAYALMITGTITGIFLGLLLFSRTPRGKALTPLSGNFFRYLLAKGFPTLVTVAQLGIILVITAARHTL